MTSTLAKGRALWILVIIMLVSLFMLTLPVNQIHAEGTGSGTIKDRLKSGGEVTQLEDTIDKSSNKLVDTARRIFIFLSIIFGIWLAISFFRAGFSPDTLRETKIQSIALIAFLIFSFWTEPILGFLFSILGIDINTYLK